MLRFPFPLNSSYTLLQDAAYILPTGDTEPFDVATAQSLLWTVSDGKVRRRHGIPRLL